MSRKLWVIAVAAWFLLWGMLAITNIVFAQQGFIMGLLAIVAAILLIIDR